MQTKNLLCGAALLALTACGQQSNAPLSKSETKIYGGKKVAVSDELAQFTVVLLQNNRPLCTGVLISPRLVVTAGHCFYLSNAGKSVTIGFGTKAKETEQVKVANFVAHEDFDAKAGQLGGTDLPVNDIALIRMESDAPQGFVPVPVLTQDDTLTVGEPVTLAGFGKTDVKSGWFGTVLGELYQVDTELTLEATAAKEVWLGNTPGKSACNGDSGGPALVKRPDGLKLLGVTSRGRDCKSEVIYTDLRFFGPWMAKAAASMGE